MEFLLSRYRNLSVLLLAILAQLVLLAYQVKGNQEVRLIRVWAVTAVTPMARVLEFVREHTIGAAENYLLLVNVRSQNQNLHEEVGRLKIENQFLKTELHTADRAQALAAFQQRTPSHTLPARIIGTGTGANSRLVFVDAGSGNGVLRGMAVITPDGIVGKVLASYPTASQVLLITDPTFAAGVISEKNRVHGTLKGIGQNKVTVDYVQNEEKVDPGEMFYTSGDDRIFPKGMPVGKVTVVRPGKTFKEIFVVPSGFQSGLEEVLIVTEGIHGTIPDPQTATANPNVYLMPPPEAPKAPSGKAAATPDQKSASAPADPAAGNANLSTDADKIRERYKKIGEAQGVTFGEGRKVPNFNINPDAPKPPAPAKPVEPAPQPGGVPDR
jgi:rod shape-determining protein MreC